MLTAFDPRLVTDIDEATPENVAARKRRDLVGALAVALAALGGFVAARRYKRR